MEVPVDKDTHDSQPAQNRGAPPNRRKFMRQVGMGAAATAAIAGLADVAGMKPAAAATKRAPTNTGVLTSPTLSTTTQKKIQEIRARTVDVHPDTTYFIACSPTPGDCGGPCEPAGVWCHWCCVDENYCGGLAVSCWRSCVGGDYYFCSAL
jgi:hypothetical protein